MFANTNVFAHIKESLIKEKISFEVVLVDIDVSDTHPTKFD